MTYSILYLSLLLLPAGFALVEDIEIAEKVVDPECIKTQVKEGAWVRGYLSTGMVDPNLVYNVNLLNQFGVYVSAYMQPCFKCGNPKKQAQDLAASMPLKNRRFMIYVTSGQWGTDMNANRDFLTTLVEEFRSTGNAAGIVTSEQHYQSIMGKDWDTMSSLMLFYIKVDNITSCSDFKPFNGWKKPREKLYDVTESLCGNTVDYLHDCIEGEKKMAHSVYSID